MTKFYYREYEYNEYEDDGKILSQHTASVEAEDRDEASDKLRKRGLKPSQYKWEDINF